MEGNSVPRNDWEALQQGQHTVEHQHRYQEVDKSAFLDAGQEMMAFGKAMAHSAAAMGQTLEEFRSAEFHEQGRCSSGCGEPRNRAERREDKRAKRKRGRPYVR